MIIKTKMAILIDEAWDMVKNMPGSNFLEAGTRRTRKHNGDFWICTSVINDCFDDKESLKDPINEIVLEKTQ